MSYSLSELMWCTEKNISLYRVVGAGRGCWVWALGGPGRCGSRAAAALVDGLISECQGISVSAEIKILH